MNRVFIGYDHRNAVAATALTHSIHEHASRPVLVTQLRIDQLPIEKKGLTDFTFTRYLVPWLCDYKGTALFLDADMLLLGDVNELFELNDGVSDVLVVKNKERFEWPSLMLFNNGLCGKLTPEYIEHNAPNTFEWAGTVGQLPGEWNHCVGYDKTEGPKLVHYTAGIPFFSEVRGFGYEYEWMQMYARAKGSVSWLELMGRSVHVQKVMNLMQAKWRD